MRDGVKPLFSPAAVAYGDAQFIANIGDELSLWRIPLQGLRIYPESNWGYWVLGLRERLTKGYDEYDPQDPRVTKTMRHIDVIEVYAAMLGEGLTNAA